jgi:putative ABC transport system permease protein
VVIVIDELLAERYWPGADPIGARIVWPEGPDQPRSGEVIGVVGRVRWAGAAREPEGVTYHWFPQQPERQMALVARASGDPAALATAMTAAVTAVDPEQPVADVRPMTEIVSADLARPRFTLAVLGVFAAVALVLAAIGLYGVVAFNAGRRTREIGVRIALGATRGDVVRLVVERTLRYVGAGLAAGTLAALASGRLVAGVLHGVTPADPITLVAASLVLGSVATLAAYLPARRATAVNPAVTLRAE